LEARFCGSCRGCLGGGVHFRRQSASILFIDDRHFYKTAVLPAHPGLYSIH
jgi:hypothetical protein